MLLLAALVLAPLPLTQGVPLTGPAVLEKLRKSVRATSPLEGILESTGPNGQKATMRFRAMYPKLFVGKMTIFGIDSHLTWNEKGLHLYVPTNKEYQLVNPGAKDVGLVGLESLFGEESPFTEIGEPTASTFEGRPVIVVAATKTTSRRTQKVVLYVDAKTYLPLGYDEVEAGKLSRSVYKSLSHASLTKKDFDFKVPE